MNNKPAAPGTTITLPLGDLGPLGLTYAADVLESAADDHGAYPFHAESLQQVADMLRRGVVALKEKASA